MIYLLYLGVNLKIAIVHEWLSTLGGSERILVEVLNLYPQADVFALTHFPKNFINTPLENIKVKTSWLQKIPNVENLYRKLLPLMPLAIESLDVANYDLVISLSHAVAHGVKTHKNQKHISYISTPMRYAWHMRDDYLRLHKLNKPLIHSAAHLTLNLLRRWDKFASSRTDSFIANSHWTASHIKEAWNRDSQVMYPCVDVKRFKSAKERDNFYLLVSRLVPYKLTPEIVKAFNELKLPLVVVGDGTDIDILKKIANENIKILGYQPDQVVTDLMNRAKAFVYMATEDFGIAMAEAQAAGCPVIAYAKGGASEIVRDEETGLLFKDQLSASLVEAVNRFEKMKFDSQIIVENAQRFSAERFRNEFVEFVKQSASQV
ncbi:MAG: glycosyl transferase group 1 [Chloroflexi bacterium OLB14]|nr:MAG: glycosyl transferase group 1 [Chloroflexi bacterium OLB14]